jgi:hypothetical protein
MEEAVEQRGDGGGVAQQFAGGPEDQDVFPLAHETHSGCVIVAANTASPV